MYTCYHNRQYTSIDIKIIHRAMRSCPETYEGVLSSNRGTGRFVFLSLVEARDGRITHLQL